MYFEEIINAQTTKTNKEIYLKSSCNLNINADALVIQIKDNKIVYKNCSNNTWVQRDLAYTQLIQETLNKHTIKDCIIKFALGDQPIKGYFNFCRRKNEDGYFLIPNFRFINDNIVNTQYYKWKNNSYTWNNTIDYIKNNDKHITEKEEKFYFMGNNGHSQRKKYFELMKNNKKIYDGYHWGNGSSFKHFSEYFNYKFTIYIDGITNSDRFRLLLLLNSVPFHCKSPYEEFYTYLLKHEENYIEFNDVSELETLYSKYKNNDELLNKINNNNKQFIKDILSYENILKYVSGLLNKLNE